MVKTNLKTRIIPCMLFNGLNLVKTIQFGEMRNLGNPIQMAQVYNSRNVDELIFIDLLGSQENRQPAFEIVRDIVAECFMPLTIGGGIHTIKDIEKLFSIGADKISINTAALMNPTFISQIAKSYGSQAIVVSIDAKKIGRDYYVHTARGQKNTGMKVGDWAKMVEQLGAGEIFLTSVERDGTMRGYDTDLIATVSAAVSIPVIACGGAGKVQDIIEAVKIGGADAVSLASMFHYSGHTSNSIKERMHDFGIPVRLL